MDKELGLFSLIALVISTMIGAGIFSLPQNIALGASAGAVTLGWLITCAGMLCLVLVFQYLGTHKAELEGGLFS